MNPKRITKWDQAEFECLECGCELFEEDFNEGSAVDIDGNIFCSSCAPNIRCPYCDEEIRPMALKCRHCDEWLDEGEEEFVRAGAGARKNSNEPRYYSRKPRGNKNTIYIVAGVVGVLFLLGLVGALHESSSSPEDQQDSPSRYDSNYGVERNRAQVKEFIDSSKRKSQDRGLERARRIIKAENWITRQRGNDPVPNRKEKMIQGIMSRFGLSRGEAEEAFEGEAAIQTRKVIRENPDLFGR